ncbi:MAG: EAL domain-containing protein [Desulfobulbaceae bacterium]|nr:EAL domain-containing protein [Desulfobulbaceae bacterium]
MRVIISHLTENGFFMLSAILTEDQSYLVQIVDDDKILRQILSMGMSKAGFFTAESKNGLDAVADFQNLMPDAILLDVIMPDLDGFEVCSRIRRLPGGERVPIIMITGQDDYQSINQAFESGATDFVVKPINPLLLSYRIRYIIRANQAICDLDVRELMLASARELAHLTNWEWRVTDDSVSWGEAMCRMVGIPPGSAPRSYEEFLDLVTIEDRKAVSDAIAYALERNSNISFEHRLITADGIELTFRQDGVVMRGTDGAPTQILFTCQDITQTKIAEQKIKFLAYYDRLTGLPNRFLFKEHLAKALTNCRRNGLFLAVLYIDIDNFRNINNTFGREIGDRILKEVSSRLRECLRRSDTAGNVADNEVTARFGADEFGIILEGLKDMADAAIVARRIIDILTKVILVGDNEIFLNSRVGVSVFPNDGESVDDLMKSADSALSCAKELERNSYQFYTAELNTKAFARFALETSLRRAVERQEFVLLYQPQVSLASGRVTGVEALIRWIHPDLGMVSPLEFIPLAEETGLIVPIGAWVLRTACAQCQAWFEAGMEIRVAINLSAGQFKDETLIDDIRRVLSETKVKPELIELEITESMLMDNVDGSIDRLDKISQFGCRLSIDDFGTGYSSLNYLKRFPVDVLKVDRSFVSDLTDSEDDAMIVKAIVTLAHNLDLEVVAEGVETRDHLSYLSYLGCDLIQGYLVSRPVTSKQVEAFFGDWTISNLT